MELCLEYGCTSVNKFGEELCGDNVVSIVDGEYTTLVLADGLGSGVKANILSTLTSKILCTMAANGINIDECVETLIQTLPVCQVRGVAYSTFSLIHVNNEGKGFLYEFDNPQALSRIRFMSLSMKFQYLPSYVLATQLLSTSCFVWGVSRYLR